MTFYNNHDENDVKQKTSYCLSSSLPELVEMDQMISKERLEIFKQEYYDDSTTSPKPQVIFNYAWALLRSSSSNNSKQDHKQALFLFNELYRQHPSRRRECLYYIALAEFKLGNYKNARNYVDNLLSLEPKNSQAKNLKRNIEDKLQKDGMIGMAIVSVAVATVGILTSMIMRK